MITFLLPIALITVIPFMLGLIRRCCIIQKLQNSSPPSMVNKKMCSHYSSAFLSPLASCLSQDLVQVLLLVLKSLNTWPHIAFLNYYRSTPPRGLRSARQTLQIVPRAKLKSRGDGVVSIGAPKLGKAASTYQNRKEN